MIILGDYYHENYTGLYMYGGSEWRIWVSGVLE